MRQLEVPIISKSQISSVETVYDIKDFPYQIVNDYPTVGYKQDLINVPCAFDIEVTTISDPKYVKGKTKNQAFGVLYQWQFCIDTYVCMGRTIEEFITFLELLDYQMNKDYIDKTLVIYVHNLAYEWQFIHDFFEWSMIFARKPRQVIKCKSGSFEFRCSYALSNKSLSMLCKSFASVTHYKLVDTYDYRKIRYPWTPMTDEELSYCYNDVRGLCQCIAAYLEHDNLQTIPLTSTGFVRRDCRIAMQSNFKNTILFRKLALDYPLYQLCRDAFRGGDVHCNYLYAGEILHDIESWDLKSSYPAWMLLEKFPMTPFMAFKTESLDSISKKYMWITRLRLVNIHLKKDYYIPYISISQCQKVKVTKADNGRVLAADFVEIAITNLDWEIIKIEYDFDSAYTSETYISVGKVLPIELRQTIYNYFVKKCELDGIEEMRDEYMKSKNKLNGIFGMMVTDILQSEIEFSSENYNAGKGGWTPAEKDPEEILAHYYSSRHNFLSYQWGIFVTAWARYHLREAIWELGIDHVYNDTDCTKGYGDHSQWFENFNARIRERAKKSDVPATWTSPDGREICLGCWEHECTYETFRSWGSKCYCGQVEKHDRLVTEITVSGVNKKGGSEDIERDGIEYFKPGYVFEHSGRTISTYQDRLPTKLIIDGHTITQASSIAIEDSTYVLGESNTYKEFVDK